MSADLHLPPLVSPDELADNLGHPGLRIVDVTTHLSRTDASGPYALASGEDDHARAHIPGSVHADMVRDLAAPGQVLNLLPEECDFATAAGELGIGAGTHVVVYSQSAPMWATRLWWMLRYYGFDAVSVLDGGFTAWVASGHPVHSGTSRPRSDIFAARARPDLLARLDEVEVTLGGPPSCPPLVNALSPASFRGDDQGSAVRPGRIPGSTNLHWQSLIDETTGRFVLDGKPLRDLLEQSASVSPIAYCGGGVAATIVVFSLFVLGHETAKLYDGSLNEWSRIGRLPLVTDPPPNERNRTE